MIQQKKVMPKLDFYKQCTETFKTKRLWQKIYKKINLQDISFTYFKNLAK